MPFLNISRNLPSGLVTNPPPAFTSKYLHILFFILLTLRDVRFVVHKMRCKYNKLYNMESVDKAVAKSLMEIKAVMLRPEHPFTWASGWKSPIYCDNRRILSYPEIRENVCRWMADIIKEKYPDVEAIAGVATGAIAHGYLVAHILGLPFCYVRPKPKDHGTGSQIEGLLERGAKVVIVEDLISTGMSSLAAKNALVNAGADIKGMVAIFSYTRSS